MIVVRGNEFVDGRNQIRNAREGTAAKAIVGQFAKHTKPAFDEIQPSSAHPMTCDLASILPTRS